MSDAGMEENGQSPVQPQQPQHPDPSPGAQLASHREAMGWTIEQVANQLNLAPRQVLAIEDDNYAALPGMVIARGFVRAYAKLLKLDPAPLLAQIAEKDAPSPESLELRRTLSATFTESSLPVSRRSGGGRKWLALVVLVLIVGAAGWLAWREGWLNGVKLPDGLTAGLTARMTSGTATPMPRTQLETAGSAETGTNGVPMGQAGEDAQAAPAEATPPAPAQSGPQAPSAPLAAVSAPATVPSPAAQGATAAAAAPAQPAAPAVGAAASPAREQAGSQPAAISVEKLVLKMREASWIELRRDNGGAVVSRLIPAGSTESFDVEPGARLVVGNANGVDATYRGKALALNADAKNNVARLQLK